MALRQYTPEQVRAAVADINELLTNLSKLSMTMAAAEQDHMELWTQTVDVSDSMDLAGRAVGILHDYSLQITPADWKPEGVK